MFKLLTVYNVCGISGHENVPFYIDCVRSLLAQKNVEQKIVISGCKSSDMAKIQFSNTFGQYISYNFIEDNVPVSVSFNHTVDKMVETYGPADGYLYIDSGISFWDPSLNYDALSRLIAVHESGPYAITAAMPSNDCGTFEWWKIPYTTEDVILPLHSATNMHAQIFTEEWRQTYGRVLPDVFSTHCMESTFVGMAAAMHKKVILTQKIQLLHLHSLDGASIGTRTGTHSDRFPMSKIFDCGGLWFKKHKPIDEIYREGYDIGFIFEQCKSYWQYNKEAFDNNGNAKYPTELKAIYKKEMFLSKDEFDYATIQHQFIPGR